MMGAGAGGAGAADFSIGSPEVGNPKLTLTDKSGFAGGNMSAMHEMSFNAEGYLSPASLTPDSGGGIDVLIHEIAHQWWGLGSMPVPDGVTNWSPEGITCYSTYSFMKQHFGEEYAKERFVKAWQHGWDRYTNAFYVQNPEYQEKLSAKSISIITGEFTSMSHQASAVWSNYLRISLCFGPAYPNLLRAVPDGV